MNNFIKYWKEFLDEWKNSPSNQVEGYRYIRPQFDDYME